MLCDDLRHSDRFQFASVALYERAYRFLVQRGLSRYGGVSGFSDAGGTLDSASVSTYGTVSGTLPGDVAMSENSSDYYEGITFGPSISFDLTLDGIPDGNTEDRVYSHVLQLGRLGWPAHWK